MSRWTVVLTSTIEEIYDVEASSAEEALNEARSGEYNPVVTENLTAPELVEAVEQDDYRPGVVA